MSALTISLPSILPFRDQADALEFGCLPDACKGDIRAKYAAIREGLSAQNARGVSGIWERLSRNIAGNNSGCISAKTLRNLASNYAKSARHSSPTIGDWRLLWNTAKWHRPDYRFSELPAKFIEDEWKPRILAEMPSQSRNSRLAVGGIRQAHRKLLVDWRRSRTDGTHPFKGYAETPPPAPGKKHPAGWSYANLTDKRCTPSEAERVAWRKGVGAARQFLPHVRSTRADLRTLQRIEFDDYRPDVAIRFAGQKVCPLQISLYDFATGCFFDQVFKPQFTRADGTKDGWKAAHIPLILAAAFCRHGYDAVTGTVLVDEGGTARADEATMEILACETGGRILQAGTDEDRYRLPAGERPAVQRPNRERLGQLTGYQGGDHGNPNRKRMEAIHGTLGRYYGDMPGYIGPNYTAKPEWFAGLEKEEAKLLKLAATLPPERAAEVHFNTLSFHEFCRRARVAIDAMNRRDDHSMEGWARFTLDCIATKEDASEWTPLDNLNALPVDTAAAILAIVERRPELFASRRLSPAEAFARECSQGLIGGRLRKLSPWAAAEVIAKAGRAEKELHTIRPRTARTAYLVVEDTTTALLSEPVFYKARILQPDGTERELRNGEDVECIFNPFDPGVLFVRNDKGRFLGVAMEDKAINPNDKQATLDAQNEARSRRAERLAPMRQSMKPHTDAIADRRRHNAEVADLNEPFTPLERRESAALTDARRALADRMAAHRAAQVAD